MPGDISIASVQPSILSSLAQQSPVQAAPSLPAVTAQAPAASIAAKSSDSTDGPPHSKLYVDQGLNLVVLQFVDSKGQVTRSIPTEKQLRAYRLEGPATATQAQGDTASRNL